MIPEIRTERLLLRGWTDADRPAFAAINADPAVMATLGPVMTPAESDAVVDRAIAHWATYGYGWWCLELDGECIGYTGLLRLEYEAPHTRDAAAAERPCVEVGWRVASPRWGQGYAPEAARAALAFGFGEVGQDEIVSTTAVTNTKSRRVMEKLGLAHDPDGDFDHPRVPEDSPLRRHALYRMPFATWQDGGGQRLPWRR